MSEEARYECLISGKIETALILDQNGGPLFTMAPDANHLTAAKEISMPALLGQADDWVRLAGLTLAEIRQKLELIVTGTDALALLMSCLDKKTRDVGNDVAKEMNQHELFTDANELLADEKVLAFVLNGLCAIPMPFDDSLENAVLFADVNSFWNLSAIFEIFWIKQNEIRKACESWNYLMDSVYGGQDPMLRALAVHAGLFRLIVLDKPVADIMKALDDSGLSTYPMFATFVAFWRARTQANDDH